MIRILLTQALLLTAGCQGGDRPVSAINFAQEGVDPACVISTIEALDGYVLQSEPERTPRRSRAVFGISGEEMLVNVRRSRRGGSEVYLSMEPQDPGNPLRRRAARLAVYAADEAVYVNCTEDGRSYGSSDVTIEGQKE